MVILCLALAAMHAEGEGAVAVAVDGAVEGAEEGVVEVVGDEMTLLGRLFPPRLVFLRAQ